MADNPEFLALTPDPETESTPVSASEPAEAASSKDEAAPAPLPEESEPASKPVVTFRGNNYDLASVVGVTVGGIVLFSCLTCNAGFYCLPIVPIILGIIGLVAARDAVDPDRTRLLSWLSVGSGVAILLLIILGIAAYFAFIFFVIMADSGGF